MKNNLNRAILKAVNDEQAKKNIFVLFLFCVIICIAYHEKVSSENLFIVSDGLGYYLTKYFLVDGMNMGELPLWNPYISIGTPFLADVQKGVFSPFNILYLFFDDVLAFNITHIIQLIIAGYFMYLLVNRLTDKYFVSIITGFIFAFSTMLSGSRIAHPTIIATAVFFPVIIYCLERFKESNRDLWLIVSAVVMAIQFVSGFTQIVLYFDLVLFIYLIYVLCEKGYSLKNIICTCAAWVLLYILLIAVQLLPTMVLMEQSGRDAVSWTTFSALSYDLRILLMMFFPSVYKNQMAAFYNSSGLDIEIYIGIICLIYIIYEIIYGCKERKVKVYSFIMAGAFIYGMAPNIPLLGKLLYHIPLLGSFRVCARSLPIFLFFAIVLAGMGMSHLYKEEDVRKIIKINIMVILVILTCLIFAFCVFSQKIFTVDGNDIYYKKMVTDIIISLVFCFINLIGLGLIYNSKNRGLVSIIICIIGSVIVIDVMRFSMSTDKGVNAEKVLDSGVSPEIQECINQDTANGYRSFVAVDSIKDHKAVKLGIYNRSIKTRNYLYNNYMTFMDEKLKYWGIKESFYFPSFISQLKNKTDLASMMGIHYILDTGEHDINDRVIDEKGEKELLLEDDFLEMSNGGDVSVYVTLADWIEPNAIYRVTVDSNLTSIPIFYADLYNKEYDNPEQDGLFEMERKGKYSTLIFTEDIPDDDVYFRIVVSADHDIEVSNLKIEKVKMSNLFVELPVSEDGIKTYMNERARQIIYIPDYVVGVDEYGDSWNEDLLNNVDTTNYVEDLDIEMDLTNSNVEIIQIDRKRNSTSAIIHSDTETFVNHSQLAYPGWKAYIDGEETKIYTVNNLIQGAIMPSGEHEVEFRFDPNDIKIGFMLTILGITYGISWLIRDLYWSKKTQ